MNKHEREQRPRGLRRSVTRGGDERMRFAGIDIGGERHAVAVVNVPGNGNLPSPRRKRANMKFTGLGNVVD
jgi:hypothetical protein